MASGRRLGIVIAIALILAMVCFVRLFDLQIVNGSNYEGQANRRLVRAYSMPAPRGEILDCNDRPIVENRMGGSIQIQKIDIEEDEFNRILYDAAYLAALYGGEIESLFPVVMNEITEELEFNFDIESNGGTRKVEGVKPITKTESVVKEKDNAEDEDTEDRQKRIEEKRKKDEEALAKWKKENKLNEYTSPEQIVDYYKKKYSVSSEFDDKKALTVVAIRYAMEKGRFSEKNPYTLARDVDEIVQQQIKEQFMRFRGVEIIIEPIRIFSNGTMASHIIGRTGRIYAEEYEEMKDKGYGMTDIIGKDGLEKVLEPYLKGQDGYKSVEMNRGGGVTQIIGNSEPKPGNFARLTLNIELQKTMERALREQILTSVGTNGAGAAIAVDPQTGGVLAMASYPSYDLTTFNEDYEDLINSKAKPLINRVLSGTYSPGSTFKPLTAIAALETGVITSGTYIADKGKYTYYDSYQPTCLVYSSTGATHGTIEVSEAIGVSCNYFFYDVGRRTGIETIDDYATKFGLGQNTGIELPESTGILASPKAREAAGGIWYPGDVLQASIGQSDNMFTPAQLASYVCTILNRGKRYSLHLIDEVVDYDTDEVVFKNEHKVLSNTPILDSTFNAVKSGMRQVVTMGTAQAAFATSKYKAAGKTGTAEVPDGRDNVLFVGFAPYDDPEIVIAVIIEHGEKSVFAANVARTVFDAYMDIRDGKYGDTEDGDEPEREGTNFTDAVLPDHRGNRESSERNSEKGNADGKKPENSTEDTPSDSEGEGTL